MARLNNDAREILCNMVTERAGEKRSALVSELDKIDASLESDYRKRLAAARVKIDEVIAAARNKIDTILAAHRLQWHGKTYGNGSFTIEDILNDDGTLKSRLDGYIKPVEEGGASKKRRENLSRDIADLDAKVAKAKQEILLRAALGMKYDEIVAIVNRFQF